MDFTTITDLSLTPMLRELLIIYTLATYEENSITTDDYLLKEFNWLLSTNQLQLLFSAEMMKTYFERLTEASQKTSLSIGEISERVIATN